MRFIKKHIKFLPTVLILCVYSGACLHDDGVIRDPTPAQLSAVTEWSEEGVLVMNSVSYAMDQFVEHPQDEPVMIERLLEASAAVNRLFEIDEYKEGEFNISGSLLPPEVIPRLNNACEQYEIASTQMAEELVRRMDSDEFEHDEEGYERMRELFESILARETKPSCDLQSCFWCKCRKHFGLN